MIGHKVWISERVQSWLSGTHLFQVPDDLAGHGYGEPGRALVAKCDRARRRKDRSITVALTVAEVDVLADYADAGVVANSDDVEFGSDSMHEANACRALLARLTPLRAAS